MARNSLPLLFVTLVACTGGSGPANKEENKAPSAEIIGPEFGYAGPVTLEGRVTDPNDAPDSLVLEWRIDAKPACEDLRSDAEGNTTCDVQIEELGEHTVSLSVTDPQGVQTSASGTLEVVPKDAPSITILSPVEGRNYYANVPVVFHGDVSDPQTLATEISVVWTSSKDGELSQLDPTPDSSGEFTGQTKLSRGSHKVTLSATDAHALTTEKTLTIEVVANNSDPTCTFDAPAGDPFDRAATIEFSGTASDVDVDATLLTATIASDQAGTLGSVAVDSTGAWAFSRGNFADGLHNLTVTVTDEAGATCIATSTMFIGRGPVVSISEPNAGTRVNEGANTRFTAVVSDPDEDPDTLAVSWVSDLDGEFDTTSPSGGLARVTYSGLQQGIHNVTITVTDSIGLQGVDTEVVHVNDLPGAPTVEFFPDPADSTDDIEVFIVADGADADGDSLTYDYVWYRDDVLQAGVTDSLLASTLTLRGDVWKAIVTPNDGFGDGTPAEISITIANAPPKVTDIEIVPIPPRPSSDLTCLVVVVDPDGDAVTPHYRWFVNGTPHAETSDTLAASEFQAGDTVSCTAWGNDGDLDGGAETVNEVANDPPTVASVAITPNPANSSEDLTCEATGIDDPQSQPVSLAYAWTINGVSANVTTAVLPASATLKGDRVICTVTPSDPQDVGAPVSSSPLILGNGLPNAPTVSISPPGAVGQVDNLICTIADGGDPDGDTVTFTIAWNVNSSPWTGSTGSTVWGDDTISAGSTLTGDVWECVATPFDGTASGPPGAASITLQ